MNQVSPPLTLSMKGRMLSAVYRINSEQPLLWAIPTALLLLFLIFTGIDAMIPIVSLSQTTILMLIASFLGSAVASVIAELNSETNRRALFAMALAFIGSILFFGFIYNVMQRLVPETARGAFMIPLIGGLLHNLAFGIIPGILTGVFFGGLVAFFPEEKIRNITQLHTISEPTITPENWPGYEKYCKRCGQIQPFDSAHCSHCGLELSRRRAHEVKFCRYCGSRIYFIGLYCPDCGREINVISKPSVYVSQ